MEAMRTVTLSSVRTGELVIIRVCGELDFSAASELADAIGHVDGSCVYELDFNEVTFIDSEVIKTLLRAQELLARSGSALYISRCSPQVIRVFGLLGVDPCFRYKSST